MPAKLSPGHQQQRHQSTKKGSPDFGASPSGSSKSSQSAAKTHHSGSSSSLKVASWLSSSADTHSTPPSVPDSRDSRSSSNGRARLPPGPLCVRITDLPEALQVEVLRKVSAATEGISFAAACRHWDRMSSLVLAALRVRRRQTRLPEVKLMVPLSRFRSLRVVRFEKGSMVDLSSDFLDALQEHSGKLQEIHVDLGATKEGCSFTPQRLDALFRVLTRLAVIHIKDFSTQRWRVPDSISCLRDLRSLHLGGLRSSTDCAELPFSVSTMRSLTSLSVHLQSVPPWLSALSWLRELHLLSYQDPSLPASLCHLVELTSLSIASSFSLRSISEESLRLPRLMHFSVEGAPHLETLPDSLSRSATALCSLAITGCAALVQLPQNLGLLTQLERLRLSKCSDVLELPSSMRDLCCLQELHLSVCRGLLHLPPDLGKLTSLRKVYLHALDCVHALPKSTGFLKRLRELRIASCHALEALPTTIGNLQSLHVLWIRDCPRLAQLPPRLWGLHKLRRLTVQETAIPGLPEAAADLQGLQHLYLDPYLIQRVPRLLQLPKLLPCCRNRLSAVLQGCTGLVDSDEDPEAANRESTSASTSSTMDCEMMEAFEDPEEDSKDMCTM